MWKKGLLAFVASLAIAGCAEQIDKNDALKACTDGPGGMTYYIPRDHLCCGGYGLPNDDENCGSCGHACVNGNRCVDGACTCEVTGMECPLPMTCTATGCVDFMTNPTHCGAYGNGCDVFGGEVCSNGRCTSNCAYDMSNCSGHCVDLDNDASNCGSCGNVCPGADAATHVARGYCLVGKCHRECEDGYLEGDGNSANGCETRKSESGTTTDSSTSVCGNGVVEVGEKCDGTRLNDQTCASVVGTGSTGRLMCRADCLRFDTSQCTAATTCGNGKVDGAEVCDGQAMNGATCETVVGKGSTGYLSCGRNCSVFDTTYCSKPTACGNGVIDSGERCDGSQLNNATCESVVGKGSMGTLKCSDNCSTFDTTSCSVPSVCGNGRLEEGEECDGVQFGGATCESLVGKGSHGSLVCNGCRISVENCSSASTCGNNLIDGQDVCDGKALGGNTCESLVGEGSTGKLGCQDNCTGFDVSGCTASSTCGNGIVELGEACDGIHLNDNTCESVVGMGSSGTLRCNSTCTGFVTSGCSASTTCGNGILEAGEICDTANLHGATCASEVGAGSVGVVLCGADCKSLNLSGCSAVSQCGNGALDEGEVCESDNLNGATCESVVGKGSVGRLKCGDGCKQFDTSSCGKAESCGDGVVSDGELCDGGNLNGETCESVVGNGSKGTLQCASNCVDFDTSRCTPEVKCGNGKLDAGEVCDGDLLSNASCTAHLGYGATGTPTCNSTCSEVTYENCTLPPICGNGRIDANEVCDGDNLNGRTCEQQVGTGSTGKPACNSTCTGYTKGTCTPEVLCGNGRIDSGERCDSTVLNGATCESIVGNGSSGVLKCNSSCDFDTSGCGAPASCGNGSIDDGEVCDGTSFKSGSSSCKAYSPSTYGSGELRCTAECKLDTSLCVPYCGNGKVDYSVSGVIIGEVCDGSNLDNQSCELQVGMGSTGTLACSGDCKTFNVSQCTAATYCGDNKINMSSETCDGTSFPSGSDECSAYSGTYASGKLICLGNCQIDTSNCVKKPYCGDGIVNDGEVCDGTKFASDNTSCVAWGTQYVSGTVTCNSDCSINYSACVKPATSKCGNNIVEGDEFCDGDKFYQDGLTCATWASESFGGGTLDCTEQCQIDDSGCTALAKCGNGVMDTGEECDGDAFSNRNCANYDPKYQSGLLSCTSECRIDASGCQSNCGNGLLDTDEVCDTLLTVSRTCANELGDGYTGTLACASDCSAYDTANCLPPAVTAFCGDGKVNQLDEWCDGEAFLENQSSCVYWNSAAYKGGTMGCTDTCELDETNCIPADIPICGDNKVNQASEECDGTAFMAGMSKCTDWGYAAGTVSCDSGCNLVLTNCISEAEYKCGNGVLDENEWCDGNQSIFTDCVDYNSSNYASGSLGCSSDCNITVNNCVAHRCGDGVLSPNEFCDGSLFQEGFDSCVLLSNQYSGGTVSCDSFCNIDVSGCIAKCGNGQLDDGEECDGTKFDPDMDTCEEWISGTEGSLGCTSTCEVDVTGCITPPEPRCGDNILNQQSEECDGSAFVNNVTSCLDYDSSLYVDGNLRCDNTTCRIDTSSCVPKPVCNNGVLEGGETCDGSSFVNSSDECSDWGDFISGKVTCTASCTVSTANCVKPETARCGDGKINQPSEQCDGSAYLTGNGSCSEWNASYESGSLGCNSDCTVNTSQCVTVTNNCGNGVVDDDEYCDGSLFYGDISTCAEYSSSYYGVEANLRCNDDCTIDDSECLANLCTEGTFRCAGVGGNELQWCLDSSWQIYDTCESYEVCTISGDSGECVRKPVEIIDLQWCNFQWLNTDDNHYGYGRVLMPEGKTADDVLVYMACSTDLTVPVVNWDVVEANQNTGCSGCGSNMEFMTTTTYWGDEGTNYCTFVFDFADEGVFACRPIQEGPSAPMLIGSSTTLTSDVVRTFYSTKCKRDKVRCTGNVIEMCDENGAWLEMQDCGDGKKCNAETATCDNLSYAYDHTETMDLWFNTNKTRYDTTNEAPYGTNYIGGVKLAVKGAFYVSGDHTISNVTNVQRGSAGTSIVLSGLSAGIGAFAFDYKSWGSSTEPDSVLTITDGKTTRTVTVTKSDTTVKHFSYDFNNAGAKSVTVTPSDTEGRMLIDNIHWTSVAQ